MAKKSSTSTKDTAAKTAPATAVKKTAVKKTAAPKAETASKSGTPKAAPKTAAPKAAATKTAAPKTAAPKAAATKKAAPKKSPAIKLTDNQTAILNKIKAASETGYVAEKKEEKTIEALSNKKLVKKGAKNKETGKVPYMVTKAGEKHASTTTTESSSTGA